jgi:hypothetical protein
LTANLQLQPCHSHPVETSGAVTPSADEPDAARSWWGLDRKGSSALRLPAAEFSSACRACDVASDVLCRRSTKAGSDLAVEPTRAKPPGPPPRPSRQRRPLRRTRTPSLDECSLPRSGSTELAACATRPASPAEGFRLRPPIREDRGRGIFESPPPCPRFCHHGPASNVLSPSAHEAGWLDPNVMSAWTRRLSSTSATRTIHEHNHETVRPPVGGSPARLARLAPDQGLRPIPARRPPNPGDARGFDPTASLAAREAGPPPGASRGFTGQGPAGMTDQRLSPKAPPSRG